MKKSRSIYYMMKKRRINLFYSKLRFFFFLSIALFWQSNLAGFRVLSIISKFWRWGANSAEVDFRRFVIYSIIDRENLTRTRCNDSDVCAEIAEREQVRQVRWTTLSGRVRRIKRRIYTAHLPTYLRVLSSFLPSSLLATLAGTTCSAGSARKIYPTWTPALGARKARAHTHSHVRASAVFFSPSGIRTCDSVQITLLSCDS